MRQLLATDYFGIFSPAGELEAVDTTQFLAEHSAANLSPDRNRPNRRIARVEIWLPGPEDEVRAASSQAAKPVEASTDVRAA